MYSSIYTDSSSDLFLLYLFEKGLVKETWAQRLPKGCPARKTRQLLPDDRWWGILRDSLAKLFSCKYAPSQLDSLFSKIAVENRDLEGLLSRFKLMLKKGYTSLSTFKPTEVCPLSPTMILAIFRSLPADFNETLFNAYKIWGVVMFLGFRGYEGLASSEEDWDVEKPPFFLKDLTFILESEYGGIREVCWGENWESPIRGDWLEALGSENLALAIIGTKFLKNIKLEQSKSYAIAIDVPLEFNLLRLVHKNIVTLQRLNFRITGLTPLCGFISGKTGKVVPLTGYAVDEFLKKINHDFGLEHLPIHTHDFKRGLGSAVAENCVNPAIISEILHHKNTVVDGKTWTAATYIQKFRLVNAVQKKIALRAVQRYEAFREGFFFS